MNIVQIMEHLYCNKFFTFYQMYTWDAEIRIFTLTGPLLGWKISMDCL